MRGNLTARMGPAFRATAAALFCSTVSLAAQSALPVRPPALDTFPPAARDALGRAYTQAETHPRDAQAAGALARALHAWEQWDAAHAAYQRAQALQPGEAAWAYLDGVALQRLARQRDAAAALRRAVT